MNRTLRPLVKQAFLQANGMAISTELWLPAAAEDVAVAYIARASFDCQRCQLRESDVECFIVACAEHGVAGVTAVCADCFTVGVPSAFKRITDTADGPGIDARRPVLYQAMLRAVRALTEPMRPNEVADVVTYLEQVMAQL